MQDRQVIAVSVQVGSCIMPVLQVQSITDEVNQSSSQDLSACSLGTWSGLIFMLQEVEETVAESRSQKWALPLAQKGAMS